MKYDSESEQGEILTIINVAYYQVGSIKTYPKEVCSDCWRYADSSSVDNWLVFPSAKALAYRKWVDRSLEFVCEGPETK